MLTWQDTSATELGFIIERALDGVEFSPVANVSAGVAAYSDAEIASCQTYYYRVIAWNAGGSSAPSEIASVTPVAGTAPKAPSNPAASALSDSAIKLTWRDNSTDETGFQVENSLDGVNFKVTATLAAKTVAWTNTGLLSGTNPSPRAGTEILPRLRCPLPWSACPPSLPRRRHLQAWQRRPELRAPG